MGKRDEGGPAALIPVVSYARTSEDIRQRDGHGVRHQLRINERTAHEHGCRVVATYSDNGLGASKSGVVRPEFDRLVADLVRGHTDSGLLFPKLKTMRGRLSPCGNADSPER